MCQTALFFYVIFGFRNGFCGKSGMAMLPLRDIFTPP